MSKVLEGTLEHQGHQSDDMRVLNDAQMVVFRLAGAQLALPVQDVDRVVQVGAVTDVPGASRHVLGVMNLRGRLVALVDLGGRLGLRPNPSEPRPRVLVVQGAEGAIGLLVDDVSDVIDLDEHRLDPRQASGCISSVFEHRGEATGLLDLALVLEDLDATIALPPMELPEVPAEADAPGQGAGSADGEEGSQAAGVEQ